VFARFAVHFVDANPGRLFARGRLGSGQCDFYFQAIGRTTDRDATGGAGRMAMKTVTAGRDDGSLKLQDDLVGETCGVSKIASSTSDSSNEAIIGIQAHGNLMGSFGHGYPVRFSLASATSHASRQSGQ